MSKGERKLLKRRLAGAWVSSVFSISLVLLLVGIASLLMINAAKVSEYFKESLQVSIILKDDVPDRQAAEYNDQLAALPYIHSTKLVSREEGMAQLQEMLGDDFLKVFETSPVPVSIDVTLESEYVSVDSLKKVVGFISASPLVDEVESRQSLVEALNANLAKISAILAVFIALLVFISIVLISNTVRLSVYSKRFTIHTMRQIGATKGFIRKPFMVRAAVQGFVGAILAIVFLSGGMLLLRKSFEQIFGVIRVDSILVSAGIVVVCGVLLCMLCAWFVVGRLIRLNKNELYG